MKILSLTKGLQGCSGPSVFLYTLLNCLIFSSYIFVRLHWVYRYLLSLFLPPKASSRNLRSNFCGSACTNTLLSPKEDKHFLRYIFISSLTISYMHTIHFLLINSWFLIDWCSRVYFHGILSVPHGHCTAPLHLEPWHRNDVKVPCVSYSVLHTYSPSLELLMPCR